MKTLYDQRQILILDFVKSMVHDVEKHDLEYALLEPELRDIISMCEELALGIENGNFDTIKMEEE